MAEEEKKSSTNNLISVLTKKKKSIEKKETAKADKDAQAMAKVQELLKNTSVATLVGAENNVVEEKKDFDMEEHKSEKSQKWLEDQVNELNHQVEEYENEILYYKEEINKLNDILNNGGFRGGDVIQQHGVVVQPNNPIDSSMNHTLIELFRHFENLHMKYNQNGEFAVKISYPMSGNGILDKFLEYFPQLQSIKRYQNRNF